MPRYLFLYDDDDDDDDDELGHCKSNNRHLHGPQKFVH